MTTKKTGSPTKSAVPSAPVSFSAAAGELLEKIRALHAEIPGFQLPTGKAEQQRLISNAGVDDEFLDIAAVMLESSAALRTASQVNPESLREAVRFTAAYNAVVDELAAFSRAVAHTVLVRRAAAGRDARAAYDLAKGLARNPGGASLLPHIAEMKKTNKRNVSPRKASRSENPPAHAEFKAGKDL